MFSDCGDCVFLVSESGKRWCGHRLRNIEDFDCPCEFFKSPDKSVDLYCGKRGAGGDNDNHGAG